MIDKIKNLKKVELHLHLDGSVDFDTMTFLTGDSLEELKKKMVASDKCESLSEYLTKFDVSIEAMQTKDNLFLIARNLVNYLESQNVIYAEIRFAPMFHTKKGLSYEEIVEAVLNGLNTNNNVKTNLILCMMRGMPKDDNLKTIDVVSKYLGKGVCAIDLAGAEDKYPLNEYIDLFRIILDKKIPFTIHAGENGSYKEIELAIKLGASRIGHGIHAYESVDVQHKLKENGVLLEICPTSNVQTNSISKYIDNPIYNFYKNGIKVCVNTDNKTVSNITLNDEYIKLYNSFNFSIDDFVQMNMTAIDSAFLSDEDKKILKKELSTSKDEIVDNVKEGTSKKINTWQIIFLVIGSPIWLSLLIAIFSIILSVYIVLWVIVISFWAIFGSAFGIALSMILIGIAFAFGNDNLTGLAMISIGIFCIGLSILLFLGCKLVTKGIILFTKKIAVWIKNCFIKKEVA